MDQVAYVVACNGSGDGDAGGSDGGVLEPDTTDEEDSVAIEDTGTADVDTPEPDVEVPEDSGVDAGEDAHDAKDVDDTELGSDPDVVDDADAGAAAVPLSTAVTNNCLHSMALLHFQEMATSVHRAMRSI